jgi:hypothetical protein
MYRLRLPVSLAEKALLEVSLAGVSAKIRQLNKSQRTASLRD